MMIMTFRSIQIEKGESLYAAVNPKTNRVYISYPFDRLLLSINTDSKSVEAKIHMDGVGNIAVNPITNTVYIRSHDGIDVIDGSTYENIDTIKGDPKLRGTVAVNPLTNTIFSTNLEREHLFIIDGDTNSISSKVRVGKDPRAIAVGHNTGKVYILNEKSNSISIVDSNQSNKAVDTINLKGLSGKPDFIVLNETSNLLYVKSVFAGSSEASPPVFYSSINVIDIAKREQIGFLSMPSNDWEGIGYNTGNNSIYIREPKTNSILKYDQFLMEKLGVIKFGSESKGDFLKIKSKPSLLGRLGERFLDFLRDFNNEREAITVNPLTNKVYVTDIHHSLLWEIDG
jgi:DNA-binding beta-propeller fold protein YncE